MGRRNSQKVRMSNMSQRQLDRMLSKKQKSDRRHDAKDWTTKLFEKIAEADNDEGA
ncbi:hypothetical protein J7E81_01470 [Bacillus sp. ISL-18]|uniref:hypothetical protein n=1 Tax=Bacillus sp. ISL-18 TaxID=2819118 RepID=UPI001BE65D43|nr:hypothetical protein [Bacillus sp. ISL-18]MBT2653915.1 hypothetical protein [Bacillus sp. ISL-18]